MAKAAKKIPNPSALAVIKEGSLPPMTLLERAVMSGAGVEVMERLMALQERMEANQARKAFDAAMAEIRKDLPAIVKDQEVNYETRGGRTNYRYESLHAVTEALSPIMAQHGLSFRWRTNTDAPDAVSVTCILSHSGGHSEETTLTAKHDHSGSKNDIQALGSAVTYLQRYTLKAALGVAAAADDDGNRAGGRSEEGSTPEGDLKAVLGNYPEAKQSKDKSQDAKPQEKVPGPQSEEPAQTVPRGHKYERTAAHNHLEQTIEDYCKATNIDPKVEGLEILEKMSAYQNREGRKFPGVRDILLLSEKEAIICRRSIQDRIDQSRNWRVELGQAILKYCNGKKVTKEEVLEKCSGGRKTIRDLDQPAAKKAFLEFERLYLKVVGQ